MLAWNVAQVATQGLAPLVALNRAVGDLVLAVNPNGGLDLSAAVHAAPVAVPIAILGFLLKERYTYYLEQGNFWQGVLPLDYAHDVAIVSGGTASTTLDMVRKNRVPRAVRQSLLSATLPIITSGTEKLENWEDYLQGWITRSRRTTLIPTLRRIAEALSGVFDRRIHLRQKLAVKRRRLLVPLGGPISNDLSLEHLINTRHLRRYHCAAWCKDDSQPRLLSERDPVSKIRHWKGAVLDHWTRSFKKTGRSPDVDAAEAELDPLLRYGVLESPSAGASRTDTMTAISLPHGKSEADDAYIHDAILVVVSRAMNSSVEDDRWIFSAQPLHTLGASAIELFWHPKLFLKDAASSFAVAARKAVVDSAGVGFEAVIEVKCPRQILKSASSLALSPRILGRLPSLRDVIVNVVRPPRPLVA